MVGLFFLSPYKNIQKEMEGTWGIVQWAECLLGMRDALALISRTT